MYISRRLADFSIREIFRKMQKINLQINLGLQKPFPKERLLSFYEYKGTKIRIKKGKLVGGLPRLIWCLIDFTFIRSIVADAYSSEGGPCYDPLSLILKRAFRFILNVSLRIRKLFASNDKRLYRELSFPHLS